MNLRTWTLTLAILAAAALVAAPPAAAQSCSLAVTLSQDFPVIRCSAGNVTVTANISHDSGSACSPNWCTYQWSYRWCECSTAPNNCPSSWSSLPDTGSSVTKYLYSFDKYLDFLVVVECEFGCEGSTWTETASDTHRVYGPKSVYCAGCSLGGGGGDPL